MWDMCCPVSHSCSCADQVVVGSSLLRTSLTGATLKDVPMITNRSTFSRSWNRHSSNWKSKAWPKKVISG